MKKKIKEVPELFNEKYLYLDNSNFFTRGRVRVLTYADQKVKKLRLKDLKKYGVNLIYGRTGGYPSMEERWIYFDEEEKFRNSKKANETK
ncbi:MAG TPA: hypothetical protein P5150_07040, partial [Candidatus Ratteibacteria bacterium]|nr:hypothetical protein [Candidatus Ratteibacteria bacterium]